MKKLPLFALALFAFTVSSLSVTAQSNDNGLENLIVSGSTSEAVIRQEMQRFSPLNAAAGYLDLRQNGSLNTANVTMAGPGLELIAGQNGTGNLLEIDITGISSQLMLTQQGNFNRMILSDIVSEGASFQAHQSGNFNRLEIDGAASGPLPSITIEQTGGMQLIINSPTSYPLR